MSQNRTLLKWANRQPAIGHSAGGTRIQPPARPAPTTAIKPDASPTPTAIEPETPRSPTAPQLQLIIKRLDDLETPGVSRWHDVLAGLRTINALASVDEVFSHDYRRIDYAIDAEIDQAVAWINEFAERYRNEPTRRCA